MAGLILMGMLGVIGFLGIVLAAAATDGNQKQFRVLLLAVVSIAFLIAVAVLAVVLFVTVAPKGYPV